MLRKLLLPAALAVLLAHLLVPAYASAADCRFVLGFATLKALIDAAEGPEVVGECLENERTNPLNDDALQQTTGGLMVWRKHDNFTAFTDGYRTWIHGPFGLQKRLNSERFDWEPEPPASPVQATAPRAVAKDLAARDRAALTAFYHATNGPNWAINKNWLSAAPLGDWFGVHTDKRGRVTHLALINNGLRGALPPELGNLARVVHLNLSWNNLTGRIPAELGKLSDLELLRLRGNDLTGGIPSALGRATALQVLDIHANALSGDIPLALGNLRDLRTLDLRSNRLTGGIPAELGSLPRLDFLNLSHNRLSGEIPLALTGLPVIHWLYLNGNEFTGCAPRALGKIKNYRSDLLPCSVPTATQPHRAALVGADKAALVAFYHATGGQNWRRNENWLSDAPLREWFGVRTNGAARVTGLGLSENNLKGELPPELGNLSALEDLYLVKNNLSGQIPPELGRLSQLRALSVGANRLRGEVPAELGRLRNLRMLNLGLNRLSGSIPSELGALANLERLVLERNAFDGGIPPELGSLHNLRKLRLEGNELTGGIPGELGRLSRLEWLLLRWNRLSGEIPQELGNLSSLTRFELRGNKLTGCLPVVAPHTDVLGLSPCAGAVDTSGALPATQLPPPPASLRFDGAYRKYVDAGGVPIVSSIDVPDEALLRARDILTEMLAARPELYPALVKQRTYVAIGEQGEFLVDLPEFRNWGEYETLISRTRGIYIDHISSTGSIAVAFEESILCHDGEVSKGGDTLVHELAHAVESALPGEFMARVDAAYRQAMDNGLWQGAYASSNAREYWAEAVMAWFGLRRPFGETATTRASLWSYDPEVATLVQEVFGDVALSASCHTKHRVQGTLVWPGGKLPEDVRLEAVDFFTHEYSNLWSEQSVKPDPAGNFQFSLPTGYYRIRILRGERIATILGYYGAGGFTKSPSDYIPLEVAGAAVTGVRIVLP